MTDLDVSTSLEPIESSDISGGGQPHIPADEPAAVEEQEKPKTVRDAVSKALKDSSKEETKDDADTAKGAEGDKDGEAKGKALEADKADAKPKEETKAELKAEDKPEAKAEPKAETEDKPGHYQAPKKFLPDAQEKWLNVPRPVQRDIDNMTREHEAEVTKLREATERYESIRQFDELARSNGRELTKSLTKLNEIENLMESNPYAGLNMILQEIGPRKPDGSAISLYDVAQYVAQQGPEKWQQMVAQRPQQQERSNPEVEQLKQQIAQMQVQQTTQSVVEPFKAQHPRFDELRDDIAMFLNSGRIPTSLSAPDRLAVAYDMAERLNPPSNVEQPATQASPDVDSRVDSSNGSKSIKSAPGSVSAEIEPKRGGSIDSILKRNMRASRMAG